MREEEQERRRDEEEQEMKKYRKDYFCLVVPMQPFGVLIITLFILFDLGWSILNIVEYLTKQSDIQEDKKTIFTALFGVSKLLMAAAPVPFILYNLRCLSDTYQHRVWLYRSVLYCVVPTQLLTILVIAVAFGLDWIMQKRFLTSLFIQIGFFFGYMYITGLLNNYAKVKKREMMEQETERRVSYRASVKKQLI